MNPLLATHIAAGGFALVAGALALAFRKGRRRHQLAGQVFVVAMLVLGATATILGPLKAVPDRGAFVVGGLVSYFVVTAWWTMRNPSGRAGAFEIAAAIVAFGCAALCGAFGLEGLASKAGGIEHYKAVASLFNATLLLLGGIGDVVFLLRRTLTGPQRLVRHLWRMCFALFLATGSFFLGQQDAMPMAARGSPVLVALAFAPFAFLAFWVFRVRFARAYHAVVRVPSVLARLSARRRGAQT